MHEQVKREAGLVGDSLVVELLLEKLLQPEYTNGVLVDGFPRTKVQVGPGPLPSILTIYELLFDNRYVQVECIKMLKEKMTQLREEFKGTPRTAYFRRPVFRVAVLFVDEKEVNVLPPLRTVTCR